MPPASSLQTGWDPSKEISEDILKGTTLEPLLQRLRALQQRVKTECGIDIEPTIIGSQATLNLIRHFLPGIDPARIAAILSTTDTDIYIKVDKKIVEDDRVFGKLRVCVIEALGHSAARQVGYTTTPRPRPTVDGGTFWQLQDHVRKVDCTLSNTDYAQPFHDLHFKIKLTKEGTLEFLVPTFCDSEETLLKNMFFVNPQVLEIVTNLVVVNLNILMGNVRLVEDLVFNSKLGIIISTFKSLLKALYLGMQVDPLSLQLTKCLENTKIGYFKKNEVKTDASLLDLVLCKFSHLHESDVTIYKEYLDSIYVEIDGKQVSLSEKITRVKGADFYRTYFFQGVLKEELVFEPRKPYVPPLQTMPLLSPVSSPVPASASSPAPVSAPVSANAGSDTETEAVRVADELMPSDVGDSLEEESDDGSSSTTTTEEAKSDVVNNTRDGAANADVKNTPIKLVGREKKYNHTEARRKKRLLESKPEESNSEKRQRRNRRSTSESSSHISAAATSAPAPKDVKNGLKEEQIKKIRESILIKLSEIAKEVDGFFVDQVKSDEMRQLYSIRLRCATLSSSILRAETEYALDSVSTLVQSLRGDFENWKIKVKKGISSQDKKPQYLGFLGQLTIAQKNRKEKIEFEDNIFEASAEGMKLLFSVLIGIQLFYMAERGFFQKKIDYEFMKQICNLCSFTVPVLLRLWNKMNNFSKELSILVWVIAGVFALYQLKEAAFRGKSSEAILYAFTVSCNILSAVYSIVVEPEILERRQEKDVKSASVPHPARRNTVMVLD